MTVEMWRGEERGPFVLDQRQLVLLRRHPEDDDIPVPFARFRIRRVRPGVAEEDERLATHLIDRIVTGTLLDGDMRHRHGDLVHILDRCPPAHAHLPDLGPGLRFGSGSNSAAVRV